MSSSPTRPHRPAPALPLMGAALALLLGAGCSSYRHRGAERFEPVVESYEMETVELATRAKSVSTPASTSPWVGPGDVLAVAILGVPESATQCVVMPDGLIYFDIAGGVKVDGLNVAEIESRLTKALEATGEYPAPVVTVDLLDGRSRSVTVLGQVGAPGNYPVRGPLTLLDLIGQAGGVRPSADLGRSMVVRGNETVPADVEALVENGDMSQNIYLRPDDYVLVPLAGLERVHVLGSVQRPTSVPWSDRLTIVAALASAGGPTATGSKSTVAVVRGSLQSPKVAVFDFGDIVRGKANNFRLAPDDIIYVPESPWRRIQDYALLALRSAASALAIRAADELWDDDNNGGSSSNNNSSRTNISLQDQAPPAPAPTPAPAPAPAPTPEPTLMTEP